MEPVDLLPSGLRSLLTRLHRQLYGTWRQLLRARRLFLRELPQPSTAIRLGDWKIRPLPACLQKRHVEITGPADPKLIVNALHSGADAFMADLEDALTPHWEVQQRGQIALYHAVRGQLRYVSSEGKAYNLDPAYQTLLLVRPRGLHLVERHFVVDGHAIPASLFDTVVYIYHNAEALLRRGVGPYLYIPKLESAGEARFWSELLTLCESALGLPLGTIRVTVLIETFPAILQTEEILYELRDHIAGLNAGRWDYLFSVIKTYQHKRDFLLPERETLTMDQPFMRAYAQEVVRAAHRRGALAIGGMSAFIPDRRNPDLNARALNQVKLDKEREVAQGFDGAWVAHPDLVPVVKQLFEIGLKGAPNQLHVYPTEAPDAASFQTFPPVADQGLALASVKRNIEVALLYLTAWLQGQGAVALFHLMEDTATAEIARAQLWQWLHVDVPPRVKDSNETISHSLYEKLISEATQSHPHVSAAAVRLLRDLVYSPHFIPFLTSYAYQRYIP
ncbi:MAG: malate synthase [Bacteroidia bacterium]|nr:malate synthase [Bacteroidia bacterium]